MVPRLLQTGTIKESSESVLPEEEDIVVFLGRLHHSHKRTTVLQLITDTHGLTSQVADEVRQDDAEFRPEDGSVNTLKQESVYGSTYSKPLSGTGQTLPVLEWTLQLQRELIALSEQEIAQLHQILAIISFEQNLLQSAISTPLPEEPQT
ncbi:MAG: hypothetical protein M1836_008144 [Candelina mexicana]|nr:MAG: hypothetical protein M1836_008144 [Candelina mexicana]